MYAIRSYYAADFSVQESEGDLIITLMPGSENENAKYYCVSNSFFEHQEGTWPDDIDMSVITSYSIHYTKLYETNRK